MDIKVYYFWIVIRMWKMYLKIRIRINKMMDNYWIIILKRRLRINDLKYFIYIYIYLYIYILNVKCKIILILKI